MTVDREGLGKSLTGTRQVTRQFSKRDNGISVSCWQRFRRWNFFSKLGMGLISDFEEGGDFPLTFSGKSVKGLRRNGSKKERGARGFLHPLLPSACYAAVTAS